VSAGEKLIKQSNGNAFIRVCQVHILDGSENMTSLLEEAGRSRENAWSFAKGFAGLGGRTGSGETRGLRKGSRGLGGVGVGELTRFVPAGRFNAKGRPRWMLPRS